MTENDRRRFAELMIANGEYFDREVSAERMRLYFEDLRAYPIESIELSLSLHRRDPDRGRFFPQIADLVEKLEGTIAERAALAWVDVVRLASNTSQASSADPIVQQTVIDMGGWHRIGMADSYAMTQLAREFQRIYAVHAKRASAGSSGIVPRSPSSGPRLAFTRDEDA